MAEEDKNYTKAELIEKLTKKERIFCHEYIIDWNGARAAREAGYSEDTAKEIASQNLTKLHIKQYIDFIKNDFEKECGVSKTRQINELAKIAYSSIAHLHNTWIQLDDFEDIKVNNPTVLDAIESIDTKTEKRKTYDVETEKEDWVDVKYVKIKLYSKIAAVMEINKMMGYNEPDKFKGDITLSGEIKVNYK